jgi:large repetitive protein
MTDARSRTPEEYVRSTWQRWGRNRRLLVAVIGALVVLAIASISAAALVGLPTILTSDSNATSPTSSGDAGGSQAIPNAAQDFAALAPGGATLSTLASANQITYVCVNKKSGQLFYLVSSCKKSQTKTSVTSTSAQFKACYQASNGVTRKVPESTKCSNKSTKKEIVIPKVPADSSSLYFCVKTLDGTMYFKGTSEPTCAAGQYAVVIGPHNRPPVATNDTYSVNEDGSLSVAATGVLTNDSDPDNDPITAELVTGPAHKASFTLNANGSFSYAPAADFDGTDSFTYKAKDSHNGLSSAATVTITVTPVPDAPKASDDSATVDEGGTVTDGNVLTNDADVDGDALSAVLVDGPANGTVNLDADGSYSYTHDGGDSTSDSFTYKANDGALDSNTATVEITVTPVDDPPVAVEDSATVGEDSGPSAIDVLANDTDGGDGGTKQIASAGDPEHGKVVVSGDNLGLSYEPNADYCGPDSFTYTLNGGSTAKVITTVTCDNDAPIATDDGYEVNEGQTLSIAAPGVLGNDTDAEGNPLTATLVSGPAHAASGAGFTLNPDGSFDYTPEAGYNGPDSFTYKASDGTADSNIATVEITVGPVNDAPTFDLGADQTVVNTAGAQTVEGFATNISAGPSDESGQALTFTVTNDDNSLFAEQPDIDETTGNLTYAPNANASGTATVSVELKDDGGTANGGQDTTTKTFKITVKLPNEPPTAADQSVDADEEVAKTITLAADDPDGDAVTEFKISAQPANGSLGPIGSIACDEGLTPNHCTADVSYTGNKDYNGPDSFQFTASDAQATGQPATVGITVNAVEDAPVAVDDTATQAEDSDATAIDVLANDTDVDDLIGL